MNNLGNFQKLNKIINHPPQYSQKPSESMVRVIYNKLLQSVYKVLKVREYGDSAATPLSQSNREVMLGPYNKGKVYTKYD